MYDGRVAGVSSEDGCAIRRRFTILMETPGRASPGPPLGSMHNQPRFCSVLRCTPPRLCIREVGWCGRPIGTARTEAGWVAVCGPLT